jgi:hypothetical protein
MMETQINATQMWKSKKWYYSFSNMQTKKKKSEGKLNEEPEHMKLKNYFEHMIAHLSIPC